MSWDERNRLVGQSMKGRNIRDAAKNTGVPARLLGQARDSRIRELRFGEGKTEEQVMTALGVSKEVVRKASELGFRVRASEKIVSGALAKGVKLKPNQLILLDELFGLRKERELSGQQIERLRKTGEEKKHMRARKLRELNIERKKNYKKITKTIFALRKAGVPEEFWQA